MASARWALLALLLAACEDSYEGANGEPCSKNKDCASDYCVATVCQARPAFGSATSTSNDAGTD